MKYGEFADHRVLNAGAGKREGGAAASTPEALQEFIARRKQKRLLELMGKLEWDDSYDYKSGRSRG